MQTLYLIRGLNGFYEGESDDALDAGDGRGPVPVLGERVTSLADRRDEVVHAVDFLVMGF